MADGAGARGGVDVVAVAVGAMVLGLLVVGELPLGLVVALLLAAAGAVVGTVPLRIALLAVAAWVLVTHAGVVATGWIRMLVAEVTLLGGLLLARASADGPDREGDGVVTGLLLAGTLLGVGLTVPDVEQVRVTTPIAAVVAAAAAVWWVVGRGVEAAGRWQALALLLVAWIAAVGGYGRDGAVVGAVGCLGLVVLEPVARATGAAVRSDAWPLHAAATWRLALHAVVVVTASRVAGLRRSAWEAAAIVLLTWVVAFAVLGRPVRSEGLAPRDGAEGGGSG